MTVTKFGHCCLLIEASGLRLLTDPGMWSSGFETLTKIDLVLVTHEHADHLHIPALQEILKLNPTVEIICNSAVGKILAEQGIAHTVLEGRGTTESGGIAIEAYDGPHAEIFGDFGLVQNTGYLIDGSLFYPGDGYTEPDKEVFVLALPVAGPWCKSADALRYAMSVKPKKAFPVHDAVLSEVGINLVHGLFEAKLKEEGIELISLHHGESNEF